jgi:hypothetical protein
VEYKKEMGINTVIPQKTGKKHFILPLFFSGEDGTLRVHILLEY